MSHGKVREDKICLNCGAPAPGRFCSGCGQENIEPKQTVWHLVNHFFSDVTHFDGKFFATVKDLFKKPGFLSKEYIKGKRMSYLDPIRMYIFTSALFFLIFFSLINLHDLEKNRIMGNRVQLEQARKKSLSLASTHSDSVSLNMTFDALETRQEDNTDNSALGRVSRKMRHKTDSAERASDSIDRAKEKADRNREESGRLPDSITAAADSGKKAFRYQAHGKDSLSKIKSGPVIVKPEAGKRETVTPEEEKKDSDDEDTADENPLSIDLGSGEGEHEFRTVEAYDSAQAKLPPAQRHNWLKRTIKRKTIEINEKWKGDREGMWREWAATFIHNFPKLLFISLPLFALLLKLLYVRRKEFYYVDHGIFSVHLYIFSFLVLLVYFGIQRVHTLSGWKMFGFVEFAIIVYGFWYYYQAMRNFYHQSRGKTLLKYFTLLFLSMIFQLTLFVIFFLFSIVQS